jgi:hypothetical protein
MSDKTNFGAKALAVALGLSLLVSQAVAFEGRGHRGHGPMDETTRAAMDACLTAAGLTPPQDGQRPSEADRAKMDAARSKVEACLKEKGISMPDHRHGPPPPPSDEDDSGSDSSNSSAIQ